MKQIEDNVMYFYIPVKTVAKEGDTEHIEVNRIMGTRCAKTNKKILRRYLTAQGVPANHHKRVLKEMGLWSTAELSHAE